MRNPGPTIWLILAGLYLVAAVSFVRAPFSPLGAAVLLGWVLLAAFAVRGAWRSRSRDRRDLR